MTIRKALNNLPPGTDHAIRMRAVNSAGVSEWSTRYVFTTITDSRLPEVPTGVTWTVSGDSFKGTWNRVTLNEQGDTAAITRYDVRLTAIGGATKVISVVQSADSTINYHLSFEANRALFGSPEPSIEMSVRAVDNKELKSAYSTPIPATNGAPTRPASVTATAGLNSINLTWPASTSTDVVGYNVYNSVPALLGFTSGTSFTYPTATYSSQILGVTAVDKFGLESTIRNANAVTPDSPFTSDIIAPGVPTSVSATLTEVDEATGRTTLEVSWALASPPNDLSDFIIYYRPVGETAYEHYVVPTNHVDMVTDTIINNVVPGINHEVYVTSRDFSGNESDPSTVVTATLDANTAPNTPSAPTASANTMQIQVVHPGTRNSDGLPMPADVVEYEVHASTTSISFTLTTANRIGKIRNGPAIVGTFAVPANAGSGTLQTWFVRVVAVDRGGLKSSASPGVQADVGLISTLNIADLAVTNAKIFSLNVNKLEADSILTKNLNIGAAGSLTVDSTGVIKSTNWVSNSTGYRLTNNALEINQGLIKASTLLIQDSHNLMHPAYSGFEYTDYYYTNPFFNSRGQNNISNTLGYFGGDVVSEALFGSRVGVWDTFGDTGAATLWFGKTTTDYNVEVEAGAPYIVSLWIRNKGTGASLPINLRVKTSAQSNAKNQLLTLPSDDSWYRYSFTVPYTPNAGISKILLGLVKNDTTLPMNIWIDGIQIERQQGALTTPSAYKPPARTTIEGAGITTGFLRSFQNINVNGTDRPSWTINLNGAAEFADASVRGVLVVGPPTGGGTDSGDSWMQSGNYIANSTGWKVDDLGNIEGAKITSSHTSGISTVISNDYNVFEGTTTNYMAMYSDNASWTPAQVWAKYITAANVAAKGFTAGTGNAAHLQLIGPRLGARPPARITLWTDDSSGNGVTQIDVRATKIVQTANNFEFGDAAGNEVVFRMVYQGADTEQKWSFRNPGGNIKIDFDFGGLGFNQIKSMNGSDRRKLRILTADMDFLIGGANGDLYMGPAGSMSNRVHFGCPEANAGFTFPLWTIGDPDIPRVRVTSTNGAAHVDIAADNFVNISDMRFKTNVTNAPKVLSKIRELGVYEYKNKKSMNKKKTRGLSAQELQQAWPAAVNGKEDDEGLGVNHYYLIATAFKAIQELADKNEELEAKIKELQK